MRIKSRLVLAAGLVAATAAALTLLTLSVTRNLAAAVDDHRLAWQAGQSVIHLQAIGYDYLISGEEETLRQWRSRHAELLSLLSRLWQSPSSDATLMQPLVAAAQQVGALFNALSVERAAGSEPMSQHAGAARAQFLDLQQALTGLADALGQLDQGNAEQVMSLKQRLLSVALVGLLLTGLALAIAALWLTRTVLHPLAQLTHTLDGIDVDNLDRRVGLHREDEVGQLARAFDRLLWRLQRATASRDRMQAVARRSARVERELKRSNQELEQFASVASHDLQEPLRTITSFLQLYLRRYGDGLDQTATEYLDYALDGARRMRVLIDDLLVFSRIGTSTQAFEPVDLSQVVTQVQADLSNRIGETNANIQVETLPIVSVDRSQMAQLFANLILNAIRYRSAAAPVIRITAARRQLGSHQDAPATSTVASAHEARGSEWVISVADNGIGIEPQYFERIFIIFQRLHSRSQYPGTGIGLAICQRIVERHGGHIWVESQPGQGSVFSFSLPVY